MNIDLGNISHIIQLAIAPAFLLAGIGTNLGVLANRLGRIIDRSRTVEDRLSAPEYPPGEAIAELKTLYERSRLIYRAFTLSTACGLFICLVIAMLFIGDAVGLSLTKFIGLCFVLGMFCFIGSFVYLLREIFVATRSLSIRHILTMEK